MKSVFVFLAALLLAVTVAAASAETITIDASADVWIRESHPDTTYENDWIAVGWADGTTRRYGLMEFDISSVTDAITAAHVELYAVDHSGNDGPLSQAAGLLVPAGITTTTYNNLWLTKDEILLDGLGYLTLPANSPRETWYASNAATANDLAELNSLRTGSGMVTVLLAATGSRREWGDLWAGMPPRLVLTVVPEPSTLVLLGTALLGLLMRPRRTGE